MTERLRSADESPNINSNKSLHSLQEDLEVFRRVSDSSSPRIARQRIRRRKSRWQALVLRFSLSAAAGTFAFAVVAGLVLAIIVPPWYRGLPPFDQQVWCNRISLLCDLKPGLPAEDILGLEGADTNVGNNLLEDTPTATTGPTMTVTPAIANPTPLVQDKTRVADADTAPITDTPSPSPTFTPSPTATITPTPLPLTASLDTSLLHWERQTWNNCGPTTMTISLTYFGYDERQTRAASFMKPHLEDKNVTPAQMVAFVNSEIADELPVRALYRVGGTPKLLRQFLDRGFPIIVERGIEVSGEGWMGHYSLIVGYDDVNEEYILFDSFYGYGRGDGGTGLRKPQQEVESGWKQFNYTFIVLYDPLRENELRSILGPYADPAYAAGQAYEKARQQARADADDKWAWFNMGTSLTYLGRYEDAAEAFDRARTLELPPRMLWYQFGPYRAYYHTQRYEDVLALALANERFSAYIEEIYFYRGLTYAAQGKADSAIIQFDRALLYNKNFTEAEEAKQAVLEGRFVPSEW